MSPLIRDKRLAIVLLLIAAASPVLAGVAPVIDSFVASPATPVPGQIVTLTLNAHDPDCATTCSSGCGLYIRSELLTWTDDTGRGATAFSGSTPSVSGSPWNATVKWVAPPADGTYTVSAQVVDSGGMLCGGQKTTSAKLTITVSSVRPPVIDSFDVSPTTVNAGGLAQLSATAHDPDGRPITFEFSATAGTIAHASSNTAAATWTAPRSAGNVVINCTVSVPGAPSVSAQRTVSVTIGNWSGTVAIPGYAATRVEPLPNGLLAIVDGQHGALLVISRHGAISWVKTGLSDPAAVAVLGNTIHVLERRARRVSRWSLTGAPLGSWPLSAILPNDLAANSNGSELALTDTESARVLFLDPANGAVRRWIEGAELIRPTGVWYAADQVAVADIGRRRLLVFDSAGALVSAIGDDSVFVRPQSVALDHMDSTWLVSDSFSGEVQVIDQTGTVRGQLAGFGTSSSQVATPVDTAFLGATREVAITATDGLIRFYSLVSTMPLPLAASNVTSTDLTGDNGGSIVVAWSASPDDPARVTTYFVERDTQGDGLFARIGQVAAGTFAYTDTTAGSTSCHAYRIVASDGVLEATSMASACTLAVNDLPPNAPTPVVASADSPTVVQIAWGAVVVSDLAGYVVDLNWPGGSQSVTLGPGVTGTRFDGVVPDADCVATVFAVDTAGNRSSGVQAFTHTFPDEAPAAPESVVAIDRTTGGTLDASWTQPGSRVPVDHYVVRCVPTEPGWPEVTLTILSRQSATLTGLVNELPYVVTVSAVTAWGRGSEISSSSAVAPSAPPRPLPVLDFAGRDGTVGFEESAGVAVFVSFAQETRRIRFLYRTRGTNAIVVWNGRQLGNALPDTFGEWLDAAIDLVLPAGASSTANILWIRNASFPSETAELGLRRLDLVPLAPGAVSSRSFDTVIDLRWSWLETRSDLIVKVERTEGQLKNGAGASSQQDVPWRPVECRVPSVGVCRDPFLTTNGVLTYRLSILSPAGWASDGVVVEGNPTGPPVAPPVTDLRADLDSKRTGWPEWRLDWTPVSFRSTRARSVVAVPLYRIYRTDGIALSLVGEVTAPVAYLPGDSIRPGAERFVVKSVDDEGRESE